MSHVLRRLSMGLLAATVVVTGALASACGSDAPTPAPAVDEGTPAPAAFVSPADGREYCGWVNNPHECDDSGYPAAPFAMPDNEPDRATQGVNQDYDLLQALFLYHIMYHSFYNTPWYYNSYIGPAWSAYPGTYYAWGGHPVVRVTNVTYYTTNSNNFDKRYSARERDMAPEATYKTKTGKIYNGTTVPTKKFEGTNAKPQAGGNATKANTSANKPNMDSTGANKPSTGSTGSPKPNTTGNRPPNANKPQTGGSTGGKSTGSSNKGSTGGTKSGSTGGTKPRK